MCNHVVTELIHKNGYNMLKIPQYLGLSEHRDLKFRVNSLLVLIDSAGADADFYSNDDFYFITCPAGYCDDAIKDWLKEILEWQAYLDKRDGK